MGSQSDSLIVKKILYGGTKTANFTDGTKVKLTSHGMKRV